MRPEQFFSRVAVFSEKIFRGLRQEKESKKILPYVAQGLTIPRKDSGEILLEVHRIH